MNCQNACDKGIKYTDTFYRSITTLTTVYLTYIISSTLRQSQLNMGILFDTYSKNSDSFDYLVKENKKNFRNSVCFGTGLYLLTMLITYRIIKNNSFFIFQFSKNYKKKKIQK